MSRHLFVFLGIFAIACNMQDPPPSVVKDSATSHATNEPDIIAPVVDHEPPAPDTIPPAKINTRHANADEIVEFAKTLMGIPYVYASTDPRVGFDCSGFITYVFGHFNIAVPRSSIEFSELGKTVTVQEALPGDLILFTGTNPMETNVGHMGLVISNAPDQLQFIHASSGHAMSVTITPLNEQYQRRFVRIARILRGN